MNRIIKAAQRRLLELPVVEHAAAIEAAYDRGAFGHGWDDLDSDGQNERAEILIAYHRKAAGEVVFASERERRVVGGRWQCRFTGEIFTDAGDLDIDHVVPLKAAWLSGAHEWTKERREQYANGWGLRLDSRRVRRRRSWLLPVSASANRSKGAKGPDQWLPDRVEYRPRYAALWIRTKHYWRLSVTAAEKAALERLLAGTPAV